LVTLGCEAVGDRVCVVVEDNGPGIALAIRERLFEPFQTTKTGGTGRGLSLSRDLVHAFGGELRLVDGATTRWEVLLPGVA
jgi:two-component system C4-dicarboxylate transport sensor histidine kinase DctB